ELVATRRRHTHFTIDHLIDARVSAEVIELYRSLIVEASARGRKKGIAATPQQAAKSEEADVLPGAVTRLNAFVPERIAQIEQLYGELLAQTEARHKMQVEQTEARHKAQVEELEQTEALHKAQVEELTAHLEQINGLLRDKNIGLAESEARGQELRNRLRAQLQATKKLSRLMDDVDDAAARLRSSWRWKLANPVTAIKAKLAPGKVSVGYGHLEKIIKTYSQWRASHPEIAKIGDEIKALQPPPISFEFVQPQFKIPRESVLPGNPTAVDVKAIAFYLPQFHRIPQNDA